MTVTLPDTMDESKVAAALLHRPELLNGYGDLVAPPLFREEVYQNIASLCLLGRSTTDIEDELRRSGQYTDTITAELRGLQVTAEILDAYIVGKAIKEMTEAHVITSQLAKLPTTDMGNAQRLTARHGRDLRHVGPWRRWLVWNGKCWARDDTGEVQRRAKDTVRKMYSEAQSIDVAEKRSALGNWAGRCEDERKIAAMIALAWSEPGVPILPDDLDGDPWLLNCNNGTIDLKTGALRSHNSADLITKVSPVDFDPDATCPIFDRFLAETACGSDGLAKYIQQLAGIALSGDISEQIFPVFYGGGSNGKTTLLDILLDIMGDYAGIAPPDLLTLKTFKPHPTEIIDLMGRRLVVASETERGDRLRVQLVKQLTGESRLKGRGMRQDFTTFPRTFTTLLVTNNKPRIDEVSHAVWRRVRLVPFSNTVADADQDTELAVKLQAERPGILAWMVRGCLSWQADGLQTPPEVTDATADYKAESNWLEQFAGECLTLDPILHAPSGGLATALQQWCTETGLDGDMTTLRRWLADHDCKLKRTKALGRCWKGVGLVRSDDGGGDQWG